MHFVFVYAVNKSIEKQPKLKSYKIQSTENIGLHISILIPYNKLPNINSYKICIALKSYLHRQIDPKYNVQS